MFFHIESIYLQNKVYDTTVINQILRLSLLKFKRQHIMFHTPINFLKVVDIWTPISAEGKDKLAAISH